jgi:hypothetical protein
MQRGGYFTVSKHNFGQYRELTFGVWFKPANGSVANARIMDFGNGPTTDNILLMRAASTDSIRVEISRGADTTFYASTGDAWVESEWRHVAWAMAPTAGGNAQHRIYVDGALRSSQVLYYPVDKDLAENYLGRSNSGEDGAFVGLMDSFSVYSVALTASQVNTMMAVSCIRVINNFPFFFSQVTNVMRFELWTVVLMAMHQEFVLRRMHSS